MNNALRIKFAALLFASIIFTPFIAVAADKGPVDVINAFNSAINNRNVN